jgi:predicted Zn-dependent protease
MLCRAALFVSLALTAQTPTTQAPTAQTPTTQAPTTETRLTSLGARLRDEVLKEAPPLEDPGILKYLARLSGEIDTLAPPVVFELVRSNRTEVIVLPGGIAILPARLLLAVKSEDELARHLTHAIGHIRLRHGVREARPSTTADLSFIPLISVVVWNGLHHDPKRTHELPSGFRAMQAQWEREADDFAAARLAQRAPAGLTPELRAIQDHLRTLTFSSKAPSLLR